MLRRIATTIAALGAGAVLVRLDWRPDTTNAGAPIGRAGMITLVVLLALLPWLVRPFLGPVADNRAARVVRAAGYVALYGLVTVIIELTRFAGRRFEDAEVLDRAANDAERRNSAIVGFVVIIMLVGGYAVGNLALTARRAAVDPAVLSTGSAIGGVIALVTYAFAPFGSPLKIGTGLLSGVVLLVVPGALLVATGLLALRRAGDRVGTRAIRFASLAGLSAGGTAALLLAIVTVSTMLLFPHHVPLMWANPDPNAVHGTPFEVEMTLGDTAQRYEIGLIFGPLIGWVLAAVGGAHAAEPETDPVPAVGGTAPVA